MGLWSSREGYDRARLLEAADRARAKRRRRQAIRLYRRVLAVEPGNLQLHARVAGLLAETGQVFDAWQSYQIAGRSYVRDQQLDQALGVYRDAAQKLPKQLDAWRQLARVQRRMQRDREARATLMEARRRFRGRRRRAEAIHLLRCVLEIAPSDVEAACALALLLAKTDQTDEAKALLERLADRVHGSDLSRVRGRQWRIEPSLVHAWRWLRATLAARGTPRLEASEAPRRSLRSS
jgi:tetratricopeptide (TPR) repeat protein